MPSWITDPLVTRQRSPSGDRQAHPMSATVSDGDVLTSTYSTRKFAQRTSAQQGDCTSPCCVSTSFVVIDEVEFVDLPNSPTDGIDPPPLGGVVSDFRSESRARQMGGLDFSESQKISGIKVFLRMRLARFEPAP